MTLQEGQIAPAIKRGLLGACGVASLDMMFVVRLD